MKKIFALLLISIAALAQNNQEVYFTTGLKIGEVTTSSAIILTRLCKATNPVAIYHKRQDTTFRPPIDFDNSMPVEKMDGAVPGIAGEIRITLQSENSKLSSEWEPVTAEQDFIQKKEFKNLNSNTHYSVKIEGRKDSQSPITEIKGAFTTAPSKDDITPILFTSSTCQYFWSHDDSLRGFKIYDSMLKLNPKFHCQTGDYIYYDKPGPMAYTKELARHKWHAMNSWPSLVQFYAQIPAYLQKDDHDLLKDDANPHSTPFGELSYADGLEIWREQVPITEKPYRTVRWGKDLQIWLVEVREYRSDNKAPDSDQKTIWGEEQMNWFKRTLEASDATFKILVSPTPIVGPDRSKGKFDNHSNASFETEGKQLRKYLAEQNVFVLNGDRHWQYVSVDPETGLREFSQGPVSDYHAQGWDPNDRRPEHKFLRVKGGFLAVKVERFSNEAIIDFSHYDVDGKLVNTERVIKRIID